MFDPFNPHFKKLYIEIVHIENGVRTTTPFSVDDSPFLTEDNAAAWDMYLHKKIKEMFCQETVDSEEFQKYLRVAEEYRESQKRWEQKSAELRETELYRRKLRRLNPLAYVPDGLTVDYEKEYEPYVRSAIEFTPRDKDDFLYQMRSLERFSFKSYPKLIEKQRPDAAYAMSKVLCCHLALWFARTDLQVYFKDYKPRIRKLVVSAYQTMADSVKEWNNEEKRQEAFALIHEESSLYATIGLKPASLIALMPDQPIEGHPLSVTRTPNKEELYKIRQAERLRELEDRRKAFLEKERFSLIPLNEDIDKVVFNPAIIDEDCHSIANKIYEFRPKLKSLLEKDKVRDALLVYLQIVKSMCRHFISDEHWNYFDDMYDPDYACMNLLDELKDAHKKKSFAHSDLDFVRQAWKEIEEEEAYWNYGIANYNISF